MVLSQWRACGPRGDVRFAKELAALPVRTQSAIRELMLSAQDPDWLGGVSGEKAKALTGAKGLFELCEKTSKGPEGRLIFERRQLETGQSVLIAYVAFLKRSNSDNLNAIHTAQERRKSLNSEGVLEATVALSVGVSAQRRINIPRLSLKPPENNERPPRASNRREVVQRLSVARDPASGDSAKAPPHRSTSQALARVDEWIQWRGFVEELKVSAIAEERLNGAALTAANEPSPVREPSNPGGYRGSVPAGPPRSTLSPRQSQILRMTIATIGASVLGVAGWFAAAPVLEVAAVGAVVYQGRRFYREHRKRIDPLPRPKDLATRDALDTRQAAQETAHSRDAAIAYEEGRKIEQTLGREIGQTVLANPPPCFQVAFNDLGGDSDDQRGELFYAAAVALAYHKTYDVPLTAALLGAEPKGGKQLRDYSDARSTVQVALRAGGLDPLAGFAEPDAPANPSGPALNL